jgi:signal transduction histidine kinase
MGSLARRMLVASDAERRRLERMLHDGAQQRLVAISTTLALARRRLDAGEEGALELLEQTGEETMRCLEDLRDLAREIYPAVLSERGLASAINDLARRSGAPVEVTAAPDERLPEAVEIAAYFVVADSLSHVDQESGASVASEVRDGELVVSVSGAALGHDELERLGDRVGALGGRLEAATGSDGAPFVRAVIPLDVPAGGGDPL